MTTEAKPEYKVIGTRPVRPDGVDKVTGRAKYGADIHMPGMLHGAILRSPIAHGIIKNIDTSKAEALPGVHGVLTFSDMPKLGSAILDLGEGLFDLADVQRNVLADDKVLYVGHAIAAVAADSVKIAREAVSLIELEFDELPPVLDVRDAMRDDAPILHPDMRTKAIASAAEPADNPTNVAKHFLHVKGDVDAGFDEATTVIEREFTTATVHQGYIEPHTATALWNADGNITVWTSTQGSFTVRQQLCGLLQQPLVKIKVVPMEIGGGFGGKIVVYLQPLAALLSKKTGRPVKFTMDRKEVLEATGPTPASWMRVKVGVDSTGSITAADAEIAFDAGAFTGSPVGAACGTVFACYDIPNARVNGYDVCVTKPATRAYRAPGATQAAFALETVLDEICEQLDIDPVEFRLQNAAKEGTRRVDGPRFARVGMQETVEAIKNSDHCAKPIDKSAAPMHSPNGKRGRGMASGFWFNAGMKSAVSANVNPDGTVTLIEGSTDIGGSRASLAMQLAETLGLPIEDVHPTIADTDSVGYTDVTGGSRVTYSTGIAVHAAGVDIQNQMLQRAADSWSLDVEQLTYEDGGVTGPDDKRLTFQELAGKSGEPIVGRGSSAKNQPGGAFGTHVVDVEVDVDTGKVQILRYTAAQDAGTAIHPSYVEGQMQGGVVQGIGWALNEAYVYDDQGKLKNASLLDYRMPTCFDVPMIETIIVEVPNPGHP
ncbi:MAG: xanthine dehydrogenase family protein molybdopterin-binding subunit, partial [Planctomycetaceae bacterium]